MGTRICMIFAKEVVLFNVFYHRCWDEVLHVHASSQEKTNVGTANIVLDELPDDVNVLLPWLQG